MGNDFGNSESNFMADNATNEDWAGRDGLDDAWWGNIGSKLTGIGSGQEDYIRLRDWDRQAGMMKIEPITKKQNLSYWSVAYIQKGMPYPQIQRIPISDVKVTPHQISFDFFDTTEGKIGVSNATEKHMIVELDIYVTDLIYYYWNHSGSENAGHLAGFDGTGGMGAYTGLRFINQEYQDIAQLMESEGCNQKWEDGRLNQNGEGFWNWLWSEVNPWNRTVNDFQQTQAFIDFRNTFLQQFSGWICKFTAQSFGVFDGVITDISYEIESGFSDAKWHVKIEEAIFTEDYSEDGTKPSSTSDGSQTNSGDVQVDQ
ncbi:MAG: hypothetical protein IKF82_00160 [Bacilli bacterium]|nr:hypothetical protein [Bacilli bacterium]